MAPRSIEQVVETVPTSDGAGVRLSRSLGTSKRPVLDRVLMRGEIRADNPGDYIAGFPSHPHRGFETVTIMLAGAMQHKDSTGNTGDLRPGGAQWMTAGRGIIHSEMPQQVDGLMWGFQLWVNLPAKDKMVAPRYQDIDPSEIPVVTRPEGNVRVMAGVVDDVEGPIRGVATSPMLLDVTLNANATIELDVPSTHNAFLYPFEGSGHFGDHPEKIERSHLVVTKRDGATVAVRASQEGVRFLVVAGRPIEEPIARHGPFVMNTREELEEAFSDYRAGRLA